MAIECHSCFEWLLPAINDYREQWPDVELDISGGFSFAPLPALARGELDLVVTSDPLPDLGLSYYPLFSYESKLVLPAKHVLVDKKTIQPADLTNETLIAYPVDRHRLDIFSQFLDPAGVGASRNQSCRPHCDDDSACCEWSWGCVPTQLGASGLCA